MYRPVSSSTATIKTQTFQHKGKVFYPTKPDYNQKDYLSTGGAGKGQQETFAGNFRAGYDPAAASNLWRTRSSGSNGSSSGTPTSPSVSSPLSRASSVGSSNGDRPGSAIGRQAAVILRNSPPPVYHARIEKSAPCMNTKKSPKHQGTAASSRSPKNATKPFNHKEVLEQMDRAFCEAKKAIESGHGKIFDAKEHGPAIVFKPFDWEEFWGQRKMNGL